MLLHEVSSAGAADLSVKIGALRLRNPILAASGTFGYGLEFAHLVDLNRLGGFVTKGLSREPIEGAPAPRLSLQTLDLLPAQPKRLGPTPLRGQTPTRPWPSTSAPEGPA